RTGLAPVPVPPDLTDTPLCAFPTNRAEPLRCFGFRLPLCRCSKAIGSLGLVIPRAVELLGQSAPLLAPFPSRSGNCGKAERGAARGI
ncbi:unnamed protein product, partial [Mycena citricolor]